MVRHFYLPPQNNMMNICIKYSSNYTCIPPQVVCVYVWDQKLQFRMKSGWCVKHCGSRECWVLSPREELLQSSVGLYHLLFLLINRGPFSVFFNITNFFSSKGHWDLVHESYNVIDNIFSPFLKGEHTNFWLSSVHLQKLIYVSDMLQVW